MLIAVRKKSVALKRDGRRLKWLYTDSGNRETRPRKFSKIEYVDKRSTETRASTKDDRSDKIALQRPKMKPRLPCRERETES